MDAAATATFLGMGAGALGGVAGVGVMMATQLLVYRANKGEDWYDVKKAYMKSKTKKYSCQACGAGACMGLLCADGEAVALGMHPTAVIPTSAAAGCLCTMGCHGARLCIKSLRGKREHGPPPEIPESEPDIAVIYDPEPDESFYPQRKPNPLDNYEIPFDDNELESNPIDEPLRKSRGITRDASHRDKEIKWYEAQLHRRRKNAELLQRGNLPEYDLRDSDLPEMTRISNKNRGWVWLITYSHVIHFLIMK